MHKAGGLLLLILMTMAGAAGAQNRAGDFDHYVLALSWIPAFCAIEGDRRAEDARCAPGAGEGWRLHGLWPQHRGGRWPEYCPTAHPAPSRRDTAAQVALFGHAGAAWHQWNKHGRCTGLAALDYYRLSRLAWESVTLPEVFGRIDTDLRVAPGVVAEAFAEANPHVPPEAMVTTCRDGLLTEIRLCLTRELQPRPCEAEMRACTRRAVRLLPLR